MFQPHGQYRDDATESRQYRRYVEDDDGSLPSDGQYAEDDEVIRPGFGLNRLRAIQPTQCVVMISAGQRCSVPARNNERTCGTHSHYSDRDPDAVHRQCRAVVEHVRGPLAGRMAQCSKNAMWSRQFCWTHSHYPIGKPTIQPPQTLPVRPVQRLGPQPRFGEPSTLGRPTAFGAHPQWVRRTPPPSHNRPFNRAASCQQPRHFSPPRYYAPTPPRQAHVPHAGQQAFDPAADAYDYTESIRRGARDGSVLTDMQQSPTLPHRVPPCQQQPPACPESSRLGARDRSAIAEIQRSPNFQQQAPLFQRQSPAKRATAVESRLNSEDARAIAQIELELGEAEQRARHNPFTGEEPARESGTRSPSETASDNLRYRDSPIYPHNTDRVYEGGIIRGNSGLLRHRPRSGGRSHSRDRSHSQDRTHDRDRLHGR